jgi:HEPN domain-containing protein
MHEELRKEVRRWFRYAEEDLDAAQRLTDAPGGVPRHPAWLAQQAAEKALKAVLIREQIEFPRTHNLRRLRALIPPRWGVSDVSVDLDPLSQHAVESRYPENVPDVTSEEARSAVSDAERIVEAVRSDLDV